MWWARTTRLQLSARLSEHWLGATSAFGCGFVWGFEGDDPPSSRDRRSKSSVCLPEMFGAILGDLWVAGLRWCVVSVAPDRWLFWCGQMWWVWLDMGQFLLGCNWREIVQNTFQTRQLRSREHHQCSKFRSLMAKGNAESPFHDWFIFNGRGKWEGLGYMATFTVKCLFWSGV